MFQFIVWNANPDLLSLGPFTVRWYGLMFAIGFWLGYNILGRIYRHEGAPEKWLGILLLWVVGATIVGARLGHVFFYEWSYYSAHPADILKVWEGGLASHGGTLAIILAVILYSVFTTKKSPIWTFDRLVIPVALVGGMIRIGNLMNSEIFGTPAVGLHVCALRPVAQNVRRHGVSSHTAVRGILLLRAVCPAHVDVLAQKCGNASRPHIRSVLYRNIPAEIPY